MLGSGNIRKTGRATARAWRLDSLAQALGNFRINSHGVGAAQRAIAHHVQSLAATLAAKPVFWLAFIGALFSWPILRAIDAEHQLPERQATLGVVRDFTLRDQAGAGLGTTELRGRVWLATFTTIGRETAGAPSPNAMLKLEEVRHRTRNLGDAFRLLTFTLDPDLDTTQHMRELSLTHRASHGSWRFVSGPPAGVREVLRDFRISEGSPHSFAALVDGNMAIRGHYDLARDDAVPLLLRDISLLVPPGD
jgi:cytochrome oxidase Cu insertion factor (SCO1/SenC/PrrC family)